jgi:hypothetical protein
MAVGGRLRASRRGAEAATRNGHPPSRSWAIARMMQATRRRPDDHPATALRPILHTQSGRIADAAAPQVSDANGSRSCAVATDGAYGVRFSKRDLKMLSIAGDIRAVIEGPVPAKALT